MLLVFILFGLAANSLGGRTPSSCQESKCGDLEQYVENSNACQKTCANRLTLNTAGACKPYTGCVCKGDLVRLYENGTGPCVPESKCSPAQTCGYNEIWSAQKKYCPPDTCISLNGIALPCAPPPKQPGCNCIENYLRNSSGICIPIDECPQKCGYNEVWSNEKKTCPPETCESQYIHVPCAYPVPKPGCNCIENYLRNSSGICIPIKECPPRPTEKCGYNEIWAEQKIFCPPQNCESLYLNGVALPCANPPELPGCNCMENYLRNSSGICIPIEECPAPPAEVCGYNEVWSKEKRSCPPETCESQYLDYPCAYPVPRPGCNCIDNHLRNSSGICIPIEQCPTRPVEQCGYNEIWAEQKIFCPPENCERLYGVLYPCARPPQIPGCNCMENHLRNSSGICIPIEECPPRPAEKCGYNEVWSEQKRFCPPETCESQFTDPRLLSCPNPPRTPGCNCMENHLRNSSGICIPIEECPPRPLQCGFNEVESDDKIICPPQICEIIYTSYGPCPQPPPPKQRGCNCINGYLRNATGICIPTDQCYIPGGNNEPEPSDDCDSSSSSESSSDENECGSDGSRGCNGDPNATFKECPNPCQPTCDNPKPSEVCIAVCLPSGCECNPGYVLAKNGRCILPSQCPVKPGCKGDPNAITKRCPNPCPPTCDNPKPSRACKKACLASGCECKPGYVLSKNGKCILPKQCPEKPGCKGDPNAMTKRCPNPCPATCDNPKPSRVCKKACLASGCECKPGYVLSKNGKCILPKQCPANPGCKGDPNAITKRCPNPCPPTCDNPKPSGVCNKACLASGCECKPGYVLSKNGKCILPKQCPVKPGCKGDPNATTKKCPNPCPATCDNPRPSGECIRLCVISGCECNPGYLLSKNGKCILPKQCPVKPSCNGDPNATPKECPNPCPPTCDNPKPSGVCVRSCLAKGCECNPGYVLSKSGKCILPKQCPVKPGCNGDPNATPKECPNPCQPTCDNPKPSEVCIDVCLPPGCECNPGYVLSNNGTCLLPNQCPVKPGCNGDPNATPKECPSPCQPTCDNPKPSEDCIAMCLPPGCVCNPGYVMSKNRTCVLPKQCPVKSGCNGDPNATPKECPNPCQPTCDNPKPSEFCTTVCPPPGCECNHGYVLSNNGKCVLPNQCPVKSGCNGDPNATPKECPNPCQPTCDNPKPSEFCTAVCPPPGCECNSGYVLSNNGKCVLPNQCPVKPSCNGDPNATPKKCRSPCQPTCDNPKPSEVCAAVCLPPGCECNPGYVLLNNETLKPGCNGDPNATLKECPNPCQPTCDNPKPSEVCITVCLPPGCECNSGYVLSKDGKCVLPNQCPVNTCPANEQYANCKVECPNNFCPVNDNRGILICDPPYPCPSGCICKTGYLRKSQKEKICIEASKCPPVKCTRPNEVWNPTPPKCLLERCENANKPEVVCDKPYRDYTPKCVCQKGFYRNDSDICVPANECPYKCPTPAQCRPTCAVPNPPNCPALEPAATNVDGCECQKGYILSEAGGKCIRVEECPQNQGCNGDPNAIVTSCPWACPATCGYPETDRLCKKKCLPVGCQCQSGYILSEINGKCMLPTDCNGGDPCGPNGTFVDCGFRCPNQYCPADDSRIQVACKPGRPCPPGCACKLNYKRLSYEDDRCILAPDCPVRECTRPNEVWSPCPSECLAEECDNVNDPPSTCNTLVLNCQPKCICQEDYYRNSSGICVPAKQCPDYDPCLSKCTPTCAQPNPLDCSWPPAVSCCEDGYILLERGGKCVRIEDCPKNATCNGDRNAIVKQCPAPCPSTCEQPNQIMCKRACLAVGCECAPGHLRSEPDGPCIKPEQCPGGNPCRQNERFVSCKGGCPTDYCPVDDSRLQIICETYPFIPCYSGCICKVNHKRKSRDDDRCILSSDCPPVNCTRQNEEWSPCPNACLRESCADVGKKPVVCNTLVLNCDPKCVCTKGHYRNGTDICVAPGCCN